MSEKNIKINTGVCLRKAMKLSENSFSEIVENVIANKILLKNKYGVDMNQVNENTDNITNDISKRVNDSEDK